MADQPTTPSGSRWEPGSDEHPTTEHPTTGHPTTGHPTTEAPAAYDAPPVALLDDPAAEERRAQLRGRAILAGAATALALGGGLTGFVIGHSTAGNDTSGFTPANSFQQDGSGQQPGGGQQFGEGQQGQQGPPSFQDHDGDGDGFGPPPGSDGSSSDGTSSNSATGT